MKSGVPIFPTLTFIIILILNGKSRGGVKSGGDIPGVPPLSVLYPVKLTLCMCYPGGVIKHSRFWRQQN